MIRSKQNFANCFQQQQIGISVFFVFSQCILSALTDIKYGPFQLAEFVGMILLPFTILEIYCWRKPFFIKYQGWKPEWFLIFTFLVILGALTAYNTETFVVPADATSFAKQPGWISLSRLIQFVFVYTNAFIIIKVCSYKPKILKRSLSLYVYVVALSSAYGIFSFLVIKFSGVDLGGAYETSSGFRLKSFFVEGGPFGIYALSGMVVLFSLKRRKKIGKFKAMILAAIILFGFLLSQSKAATLAGVIIFLLSFLLAKDTALKKHWKFALVFILFVGISAAITGAAGVFGRIMERRDELTLAPEMFGDDANILMGRIAGAVIVPSMISLHPLQGVGLGNYSLLRDSPIYNPSLPAVNAWDLHGLGLYGLTAEVGILGLSTLIFVLLGPFLATRKISDSIDLVAFSIFPLVAFIFGVQPTFLYPWVIYAFAISSIRYRKQSNETIF